MHHPLTHPGFTRIGPKQPRLPVVIAVPHAGREYPESLLANAAISPHRLAQLEDRHADMLVSDAVGSGAIAIVAVRARAWLDLNRDPREIDPAMIADAIPPGLIVSKRTRSGLGLFPRRIGTGPELWRHRMTAKEIAERIAALHEPYHAALAAALAATRDQFGIAILIDCHSMPPIRPVRTGHGPSIVIGDRFGKSASSGISDRIEATLDGLGIRFARNTPYAGGYTLDRHGNPGEGIHAIQIEFDRSLYLDKALDAAGPGMVPTRRVFNALFHALANQAGELPGAYTFPAAAE